MNVRKIITALLVLFAVGSLIYAFLPEGEGEVSTSTDNDTYVAVFYFHGNARCQTCRLIETSTQEAVNGITNSGVRWRAINVEEPGNEHFISDFRLTMKTVVIAEVRNGQIGQWEQMNEVWPLARSRAEFINYIQTGVRRHLEALDA